MQDGLEQVAFALNSVAIHLVRRTRAADQALGVPPAQLSALSVLVFGGDSTIAELAAAEQVTSPTMTRVVDGLERAALARRRSHPTDRRAVSVSATSKGRRLMQRGRQNRVAVLSQILEHVAPADLDSIARATAALAEALNKSGGRA